MAKAAEDFAALDLKRQRMQCHARPLAPEADAVMLRKAIDFNCCSHGSKRELAFNLRQTRNQRKMTEVTWDCEAAESRKSRDCQTPHPQFCIFPIALSEAKRSTDRSPCSPGCDPPPRYSPNRCPRSVRETQRYCIGKSEAVAAGQPAATL